MKWNEILENEIKRHKLNAELVKLRLDLYNYARDKWGNSDDQAMRLADHYIGQSSVQELVSTRRDSFTKFELNYFNSRVKKAKAIQLEIHKLS